MELLDAFIALTPLERRRKRREFLAALWDAVADGKLTEEEITRIERLRDEHGIAEEDLRPMRVQLYAAAYEAVAADSDVTEGEWTEMQKIQRFLGIEDREVARTKKELLRLHMLREIRDGNLPLIPAPAGLALAKGESVHWKSPGRDCDLVLTDRRIVRRGGEPGSVRVGSVTDVAVSGGTLRVSHGTSGMLEFAPADPKDAPLLRGLLLRIIAARNA